VLGSSLRRGIIFCQQLFAGVRKMRFRAKASSEKRAFTAMKNIASESACFTSQANQCSEKLLSRYGKILIQTTVKINVS